MLKQFFLVGLDYTEINTIFEVKSGEDASFGCVNVTAIDDDYVENVEQFTVTAQVNESNVPVVLGYIFSIDIEDNDGEFILHVYIAIIIFKSYIPLYLM